MAGSPLSDVDLGKACTLAVNLIMQSGTVIGPYYRVPSVFAVTVYQAGITLTIRLSDVTSGEDLLQKMAAYTGLVAAKIVVTFVKIPA